MHTVVGLRRSLVVVGRTWRSIQARSVTEPVTWREENPNSATATNPVEAARVAKVESEIRGLRMENEFLKMSASQSRGQRNSAVEGTVVEDRNAPSLHHSKSVTRLRAKGTMTTI